MHCCPDEGLEIGLIWLECLSKIFLNGLRGKNTVKKKTFKSQPLRGNESCCVEILDSSLGV